MSSDPIAEAAQRLADSAPPIAPEIRDRLAAIFRSARLDASAGDAAAARPTQAA